MLWIFAITALAATCFIGFRYSATHLSDFTGYYSASKILATHDSLENIYDDEWFKHKVRSFDIPESTFVMYVNPPPVSFIMLPFAPLPPFHAKLVWNILSLFLLFLAFFLMRKPFGLTEHSGYEALLLATLCTIPLMRNLQRGQIYVMLLVIAVFLWRGYTGTKPWVVGISLASLLLLKYFGWLFIPLLMAERRWKEVGATLLCAILGFALSVAVLGLTAYERHIKELSDAIRNMDTAFTGLPCVPAFFGSLFVYHPCWNPYPVADIPWLATSLSTASLGFALMLTLWKRKGMEKKGHSIFFAVMVLSVIFTPLAAEHHYILLVPPVFFMMSGIKWKESRTVYVLVICVLVYAILGWLPAHPASLEIGWMKLLSFPHLYAAVFLWYLLIFPKNRFLKKANDTV